MGILLEGRGAEKRAITMNCTLGVTRGRDIEFVGLR